MQLYLKRGPSAFERKFAYISETTKMTQEPILFHQDTLKKIYKYTVGKMLKPTPLFTICNEIDFI